MKRSQRNQPQQGAFSALFDLLFFFLVVIPALGVLVIILAI